MADPYWSEVAKAESVPINIDKASCDWENIDKDSCTFTPLPCITPSLACAPINKTGLGFGILDSPSSEMSIVNIAETCMVETVSVILRIFHSFVGDLTVTLRSPSGTIAYLFDHVGEVGIGNMGDASQLGFVDVSELCKLVPILCADSTFGDYKIIDGGGDLTIAAGLVGPNDKIPEADYFATRRWQSGDDPTAPPIDGEDQRISLNDTFSGESANGSWVLTISDDQVQDDGSLFDWTLKINEFL